MITMTSPTTNFPAMQGAVGNRLATYSTQLPPQAIESFLGHDPRSRFWKKLPGDIEAIYSKIQRATNPKRTKGIIEYIKQRFRIDATLLGAFPAVSIAVQEPIKFVEIDAEKLPGVGNLEIDMSARNARIVVDGLARISGVLELIERSYDESLPEEERDELRILIKNFSVPVVIFAPHPGSAPLTRKEMGQLFFDFNFKAQSVPARIAIALDQSDLYIQATNLVAKQSRAIIDNGGMEERAASLGKKSTSTVVQQVLLRAFRGAMEGAQFQESNKSAVDEPNLTIENLQERADQFTAFIDAFAEEMGDKFSDDRKSLHLSSPGWQIIGIIFNDVVMRLHSPEPEKVARALARIDWSRSGELWTALMVERELKNGGIELVLNSAGASTKRDMVMQVRKTLKIDELLAAIEVSDEASDASEPSVEDGDSTVSNAKQTVNNAA